MVYKIYETRIFSNKFQSFSGNEQKWIKNIKQKLKLNPTGKPLKFSWFMEKKYLNKRLYFIIDEETKKILIITFASKKQQQKIIDFVIENQKQLFESLRLKRLS